MFHQAQDIHLDPRSMYIIAAQSVASALIPILFLDGICVSGITGTNYMDNYVKWKVSVNRQTSVQAKVPVTELWVSFAKIQ